jgi:TetR/AcrR family transcriptional repressor of nem operon
VEPGHRTSVPQAAQARAASRDVPRESVFHKLRQKPLGIVTRHPLDKTKTIGHIETVARQSLKEKLLDAAVHTLHRQGYHGSSIGDIALAAGAPKGSVYNHFSSKEDLAIAALEEYRLRDHSDFAILEDASISPKERLRRHFTALSALEDEMLENGCLLGNIAAEANSGCPQVRDYAAKILRDWTKLVEKCLAEAKRKGELSVSISSPVLAGFLINALEGSLVRSKVERSRAPLEHFRTVVLSTLLA